MTNETEYYVELQDKTGTYYGTTDIRDNPLYFDDLMEATLYAKSQVNEEYILARVVESSTRKVVDYHQYGV